MKNVAILLSGHVRSYEVFDLCLKYIKTNLIDCNKDYDFYIFCHTWAELDWNHDNAPGFKIYINQYPIKYYFIRADGRIKDSFMNRKLI